MSVGRTYVGFGLGPIQAGLYLHEAMQSGAFARLVVAYRRPGTIAAIRAAGGMLNVNVAGSDGIEPTAVGPVEVFDVGVAADRERLVEAIDHASELSTAVSSVHDYASAQPGSIHRLLARGLRSRAARGERSVVYASENKPNAAALLAGHVAAELGERERARVSRCVCFADTVIGKMSRTVADPREIERLGLAPVAPTTERAFLVESYREVMMSRVRFRHGSRPAARVPRGGRAEDHAATFTRALACFEEKDDLVPFEEAKLYGHNATHAIAAYLGWQVGATYLTELAHVPGFLRFLRHAALDESGAALRRRHAGTDPMFTRSGYESFSDRLIERMLNPHLEDTVQRVGRDPRRKLGWDDRLVGTMRIALQAGIEPVRHALGAAAALEYAEAELDDVAEGWRGADPSERRDVMARIRSAQTDLQAWRDAGRPPLDAFCGSAAGDARGER